MSSPANNNKTATDVKSQSTKLIAMYFTQFHAIPENNTWWGEGFTDWDNVKAATPHFEGHYQPRVPLGGNYYDQSKIDTLRWQIDLAKKHGVYGFCHYHYWFDGKQLLETPTNLILENKEIDFPFCLSWANETWSRRWDGRDHHVLIKQTHPPTEASWKKHYDYLIKAWKDPRAIKVDGKPVFVIYRPQNIEKIDQMIEFWRGLIVKDGLPGLYVIFQKGYEVPDRACLNAFDAIFQFQPFEAIYSPTFDKRFIRRSWVFKLFWLMPNYVQELARSFRTSIFRNLTFNDYCAVWKQAVEVRPDEKYTTYPGAFLDWDNTSRYKKRAIIFKGASPESFEKWFTLQVASMPQRNLPENFIFINAWNEWSEGTYMEPDEKYGYQYLEAIKRALG